MGVGVVVVVLVVTGGKQKQHIVGVGKTIMAIDRGIKIIFSFSNLPISSSEKSLPHPFIFYCP